MYLVLFVMFDKSMNFIRRLNRENSYFQTRVFNLVANSRYGSYGKNTKFQLNISKIMPAKAKKQEHGM